MEIQLLQFLLVVAAAAAAVVVVVVVVLDVPAPRVPRCPLLTPAAGLSPRVGGGLPVPIAVEDLGAGQRYRGRAGRAATHNGLR